MTSAMVAFSVLAVLLIVLAASAYGLICLVTHAAKPATTTAAVETSGPSNEEAGYQANQARRTLSLSHRDDELAELLKRRQQAREHGMDTPSRAFLRDLLIRQMQDELMEAEGPSVVSPADRRSRVQAP